MGNGGENEKAEKAPEPGTEGEKAPGKENEKAAGSLSPERRGKRPLRRGRTFPEFPRFCSPSRKAF